MDIVEEIKKHITKTQSSWTEQDHNGWRHIEMLELAAIEITRLNECLKWEQHCTGRQGTHSADCFKWGPQHYECLETEASRLRAELADREAALATARREAANEAIEKAAAEYREGSITRNHILSFRDTIT